MVFNVLGGGGAPSDERYMICTEPHLVIISLLLTRLFSLNYVGCSKFCDHVFVNLENSPRLQP